jgi:arsenate reductase
MAEGLARHILGPPHEVESAGTRPSSVHPLTIEVLRERGIDISSHRSKSVLEFDLDEFDLFVTLCHEEQCPMLPSHARQLHWPLSDPTCANSRQQAVELFRKTRDEIARLLNDLKDEIGRKGG